MGRTIKSQIKRLSSMLMVLFTSKPPEINHIEHQIHLGKGTTSALEMTNQRLQESKSIAKPDSKAQIEELTRHNGHLRCEIDFYRHCFEVLQKLRSDSCNIYERLFLLDYFKPDTELQELVQMLRDVLERSSNAQTAAEHNWLRFWGLSPEQGNTEYDVL